MRLENNVRQEQRVRGFWVDKASSMNIGQSRYPLTHIDSTSLMRAMRNLGFKYHREKQGDNLFRVWRDK